MRSTEITCPCTYGTRSQFGESDLSTVTTVEGTRHSTRASDSTKVWILLWDTRLMTLEKILAPLLVIASLVLLAVGVLVWKRAQGHDSYKYPEPDPVWTIPRKQIVLVQLSMQGWIGLLNSYLQGERIGAGAFGTISEGKAPYGKDKQQQRWPMCLALYLF